MTISPLLLWFHNLENWEQLICWLKIFMFGRLQTFAYSVIKHWVKTENLKFHNFSMTWTHFPIFNDFARSGIRISNSMNFHGHVNAVPVKPLDNVDLGLQAHPNWLALLWPWPQGNLPLEKGGEMLIKKWRVKWWWYRFQPVWLILHRRALLLRLILGERIIWGAKFWNGVLWPATPQM